MPSFGIKTSALRTVLILALAVFAGAAVGQEDPIRLFGQAQDLHEKGDLSGAIALYEKAISLMPEFPEAEYQRASALISLGRADDALKGFLRASELRDDWSLPLTAAGDLLAQKGSLSEARPLIEKALTLDPQSPQALAVMTHIEISAGAERPRLQKLLDTLRVLTTKANPTASVWFARASLENALGETEAASSSLSHTLAVDPAHRGALLMTARNAVNQGDLDRARSLAAQLETLKASPGSLRMLRALIFARLGDDASALKEIEGLDGSEAASLRNSLRATKADPADLEKRLADDPKNLAILSRLCNAFRLTDPAKALDYCQRASEADPKNVDHAIGFAAALVQAKRYDAAVTLLRKITNTYPDNWTARANLATALFQLNRFAEAKPEYQWLSEKQPDAAGPHLFLGIVFDRLEEYRDALVHYQAYLRLADPIANKLDIDKINLRLPQVEKLTKKK